MKTKENIYLDLSKLTEEEQNEALSLVPKTKHSNFDIFSTYPYLHLDGHYGWYVDKFECVEDKTEVSFSEFKELFGKTEQLEADKLENLQTKNNMTLENAKELLQRNGYFVFPKAEEGDFPDLSGFEGVEMDCFSLDRWMKDTVYLKQNERFQTKYGFYDIVRTIQPKTITLSELFEKAGLNQSEYKIEE